MSKERIRAIEIEKCFFMSPLTRCFLGRRCVYSRVGSVTLNPLPHRKWTACWRGSITNQISTKLIFLYFGQEIYNRFRIAQIFQQRIGRMRFQLLDGVLSRSDCQDSRAKVPGAFYVARRV